MLLDIPFQVNEADLKECLKSRLDVIADIVVEVDEPTWLEWQDRRARHSPGFMTGIVKSEEGLDFNTCKVLEQHQQQQQQQQSQTDELCINTFNESTVESGILITGQTSESNISNQALGHQSVLVSDLQNDPATDTVKSTTTPTPPSDKSIKHPQLFTSRRLRTKRKRRRATTSASVTGDDDRNLPRCSENNYHLMSTDGAHSSTQIIDQNYPLYHQTVAPPSRTVFDQQQAFLIGGGVQIGSDSAFPTAQMIDMKHEVIDLSGDDDDDDDDKSGAAAADEDDANKTFGSFIYGDTGERQMIHFTEQQPVFNNVAAFNYECRQPIKPPKPKQRRSMPALKAMPSYSNHQQHQQPQPTHQSASNSTTTTPRQTLTLKVGKKAARKYECRFCSKMHTSNQNRIVHERIHLGVKPFQCKICFRRFNQSSSYRRHLRLKHGVEPKTVNSKEIYQLIMA